MTSALSTFKPILYIDMDNVLVDFQSGKIGRAHV